MGTRAWIAALAATGLLAACGTPPVRSTTVVVASTRTAAAEKTTAGAIDPSRESSPPSTVAGYAYADPGDVCARFAAALFSADTTVDIGPEDAVRRAGGYADAGLAASLLADTRDGRWETWRSHRARTQTTVSAYADVEQQPDSSVTAYRAVGVVATPLGDDGWQGWTQTVIVYCTLRNAAAQWRVADQDIAPVAGTT